MRGGKREGSGRKVDPSKQIRVKETTIKELEKISGKTWDDKIQKLLSALR